MKRVFCLLLAASLFLLTGCFGKSEGEETSSRKSRAYVLHGGRRGF